MYLPFVNIRKNRVRKNNTKHEKKKKNWNSNTTVRNRCERLRERIHVDIQVFFLLRRGMKFFSTIQLVTYSLDLGQSLVDTRFTLYIPFANDCDDDNDEKYINKKNSRVIHAIFLKKSVILPTILYCSLLYIHNRRFRVGGWWFFFVQFVS